MSVIPNIFPGNVVVNNSLTVQQNLAVGADMVVGGDVNITGSLVAPNIQVNAGVSTISVGTSTLHGAITLSAANDSISIYAIGNVINFSATQVVPITQWASNAAIASVNLCGQVIEDTSSTIVTISGDLLISRGVGTSSTTISGYSIGINVPGVNMCNAGIYVDPISGTLVVTNPSSGGGIVFTANNQQFLSINSENGVSLSDIFIAETLNIGTTSILTNTTGVFIPDDLTVAGAINLTELAAPTVTATCNLLVNTTQEYAPNFAGTINGPTYIQSTIVDSSQLIHTLSLQGTSPATFSDATSGLLKIQLWGAGGANSVKDGGQYANGGAGGYVEVCINYTAGDEYFVKAGTVGGEFAGVGSNSTTGSNIGGGGGGPTYIYKSSGGGPGTLNTIFAIAGGGGGAGADPFAAIADNQGGAGGLAGQSAAPYSAPFGKPVAVGGQTAPPPPGPGAPAHGSNDLLDGSAGTANNGGIICGSGGNAGTGGYNVGGGGGGGGWYGGGGGSANAGGYAAGAGGSSYIDSTFPAIVADTSRYINGNGPQVGYIEPGYDPFGNANVGGFALLTLYSSTTAVPALTVSGGLAVTGPLTVNGTPIPGPGVTAVAPITTFYDTSTCNVFTAGLNDVGMYMFTSYVMTDGSGEIVGAPVVVSACGGVVVSTFQTRNSDLQYVPPLGWTSNLVLSNGTGKTLTNIITKYNKLA